VIKITFVFHRTLRSFLCRDGVFRCEDCCLVSGSWLYAPV